MSTNYNTNNNRNRQTKNNNAKSKASAKGKINLNSKYSIPALAVLLILGFLFIELNQRFFKIEGVPTWDEIFNGTGLSSDMTTVEGDLSVHFIDVGQGDCQLIKSGSKSVLIDCGEREHYKDVLQYLEEQEVTRLDYVVVTHPHSDHAGGMGYILEKLEIGTVIMPKLTKSMTPTTNTYMRILEAIDSKNIKLEYAQPGKSYRLDDAQMTVLSPVKDYSNLNNYSVAIKLTHGENSFLFMGDTETDAEADLLQSGADVSAKVLKVGHHGSSTSTSQDFLDKVNPQYAVIEVGDQNSYGHPHDETLKRLKSKKIEIYRTDKSGSIVFVSDGKTFNISKEN